MPSYDDWNKIDEDEDEELQDASFFEGKKDVILFCIDCSESMLALRDDPLYEDVKTCHVLTALEAAMQIQKKKIIVGPNDSVGILLFNTTRKSETKGQGSEIKKNTYLYQPIAPVSAPTIQELIQLLDAVRENSDELAVTFPPLTGKRVAMGDVFTSCNWVLRDGAPKTASKRVFLITDEDDPHSGPGSKQLVTSARTTLSDLVQAGVTIEPFFISTPEKPFDPAKFYSSVLLPTNAFDEGDEDNSSILPESISITRIDDLLSQMRFHEVPKRAQFSIPFDLAPGFTIGVKGFGLVTEQRKGVYKYFVDLGDRMEEAHVRTVYVDEDRETEVDKTKMLYGMSAGPAPEGDGDDEDDAGGGGKRAVKVGQRPFYTADEIKSFRTLGLDPMIKLLGFKDRKELAFEDNIKHSFFIYPDEHTYSGSKRTFSALLKSMIKKKKIGLALALPRRNSSPTFCAMIPQAEKVEDGGWNEPSGFHLIPLPFADDIRAAPIEEGFRAADDIKDAARAWIDKLCVKNGSYPPDSYPNPALAFHNAQLQAQAFREEFDPDAFEDLTLPNVKMVHKRAGALLKEWKSSVIRDESANVVVITGSKRKAEVAVDAAEMKSIYDSGMLSKLKVDQLKAFLKSKGQPVSGKKDELIERISQWLDAH